MTKAIALILLFTFSCFTNLSAQQNTDKTIIKIARTDVIRRFKLTEPEFQQFKKDKRNSTSDLFKPKSKRVSDTTLLADSVYSKAYRNYAYIKARGKADSTVIMIVGGTIIIVCVAVAVYLLNDLGQTQVNFPY
ncbi:MAG TPA: hypothetical protein VGB63_13765 [Pedobacter sp.]|jgi:hypothetical protein